MCAEDREFREVARTQKGRAGAGIRTPSPPVPLPRAGGGTGDLAGSLPTFDAQVARIATAELGEGWLVACEDAGRFLALSRELVAELADVLRSLGDGPVLEVCAGGGELAASLAARGIPVIATDASPPAGSAVQRASADEALRRHGPAVVLGSFVPVDAGVDAAVMHFPSVRHYVVLSARTGGLLGSADLWRNDAWAARPLAKVSRRMLTRHDVWLGRPDRPIVQHGEAWLFQRRPGSGP